MKIYKKSTNNTYDVLANKLTRFVFEKIKNCVLNDDYGYFDVKINLNKNGIILEKVRVIIQEISSPETFKNRNYNIGGGFTWDKKNAKITHILLIVNLNKNSEIKISNNDLQSLHSQLSASLRHELEHFRQYHLEDMLTDDISGLGILNNPEEARKYFFHKDEINAYLKESLYMMRKNPKTTLVENFMNMLDDEFYSKKSDTILEEGIEWNRLYMDIQAEYFKYANSLFPFLTKEQFGDTTIKSLI